MLRQHSISAPANAPAMLTNPNPRGRPVSRSVMTRALQTRWLVHYQAAMPLRFTVCRKQVPPTTTHTAPPTCLTTGPKRPNSRDNACSSTLCGRLPTYSLHSGGSSSSGRGAPRPRRGPAGASLRTRTVSARPSTILPFIPCRASNATAPGSDAISTKAAHDSGLCTRNAPCSSAAASAWHPGAAPVSLWQQTAHPPCGQSQSHDSCLQLCP